MKTYKLKLLHPIKNRIVYLRSSDNKIIKFYTYNDLKREIKQLKKLGVKKFIIIKK